MSEVIVDIQEIATAVGSAAEVEFKDVREGDSSIYTLRFRFPDGFEDTSREIEIKMNGPYELTLVDSALQKAVEIIRGL